MLKFFLLKTLRQSGNKRDLITAVAAGIPDGITVPFVLAAGLSAVITNTSVIFISGLAAVATGAITMGLGAYFTNKTESEHFNSDIKSKDLKERKFLSNLGINEEVQDLASEEIVKENVRWDDLMKNRDSGNKAGKTGLTVAIAYIAGGLIPLVPFILCREVITAIKIAMLITLAGLCIFGPVKSRANGINPWTGTLRILLFAALAAGCAYGVAAIITH